MWSKQQKEPVMANKKIRVRVNTIIIKVIIPIELEQAFLAAFRANHDERFVYAGLEKYKEDTIGFLIQLKPNNRPTCYDYLEALCQSVGLILHRQDTQL